MSAEGTGHDGASGAPSVPGAFAAIRGQGQAIAFLAGALQRGRIPSAYLFMGPHHVGKRTTALALARALNCEREEGDPGGECPSCRKIDEDVHPDVETVLPQGQFIKVDQVRGIAAKLGLIPMLARKRVIVISQAERMNLEAANAFLKTLEEPPHDTLIVLCAENPARLPETIVSRCVPVRFGPLKEADLRDLLAAPPGSEALDGDALEFMVRFAQGRLRPELSQKAAHWLGIRERMVHALESGGRPIYHQLSGEIAKWSGSDDWRFVLEWLECWFRDVALLAAGGSEASLVNQDRIPELQAWTHRHPPAWAERCFRRVLAARDAIGMNNNKALALEAMWLEFNYPGPGGGVSETQSRRVL